MQTRYRCNACTNVDFCADCHRNGDFPRRYAKIIWLRICSKSVLVTEKLFLHLFFSRFCITDHLTQRISHSGAVRKRNCYQNDPNVVEFYQNHSNILLNLLVTFLRHFQRRICDPTKSLWWSLFSKIFDSLLNTPLTMLWLTKDK